MSATAPPPDARICLVTAPSEEVAARLAKEAVEARLAACVNLVRGVRSIYRWQGKIEDEAEVLMVIKTTASRVEALERFIIERHPYDTPEFLVGAIEGGASRYLDWLAKETEGAASAD